jgi:RNA polymerase sigma factor (sigma-70 family)
MSGGGSSHDRALHQPGDGNAACFHTTLWTEVMSAGNRSEPRSEAALARLCQLYWLPVYAFIRKRGSSPENAADLTQSFFAKFLEMNYVARADRERGRFRSFLMSSVANYLRDEHARAHTLKRGGRQVHLSLDAGLAEAEFLQEAEASTPASAFEKQWANTVLNAATQRLAAELREQGRSELFEHLQAHLWGESNSVPRGELAAKLGLSEVNLRVSMHRLRQRYREVLREEIAQTVDSSAEIEDEIRYLMQVVGR